MNNCRFGSMVIFLSVSGNLRLAVFSTFTTEILAISLSSISFAASISTLRTCHCLFSIFIPDEAHCARIRSLSDVTFPTNMEALFIKRIGKFELFRMCLFHRVFMCACERVCVCVCLSFFFHHIVRYRVLIIPPRGTRSQEKPSSVRLKLKLSNHSCRGSR